MKFKSLIQNSNHLEVAEVEIEFIPGIPQIHFLGLPDRIIKESFYRIKAALKNSGFKFPLTSQIIVNIKPNHLRKSSRGLELAVALGILLRSEQIPPDSIKSEWILYGEIGLDGNVYEPTDLKKSLFSLREYSVLTGREVGSDTALSSDILRIHSLKKMEIDVSKKNKFFKRPEDGLKNFYSEDEAEFLFLSSVSGLHSLLAGDSGAGKSTLARSISSFLTLPEPSEFVREENNWRPVVSPHQSITPAAFLGGGATIYEGEIERVQGGILLLDELLEFDSEILEALRGPMTGDTLRLARGSEQREFKSHFQVVATTNLCPCGKWSPVKGSITCRFSRTRCTRYLEKFSGPLLDRFGILLYKIHRQKRTISGEKIFERIEKYLDAKSKLANQLESAKLPEALMLGYCSHSARRVNYLEKVARIYAVESLVKLNDCGKNQLKIEIDHLNRAENWVIKPFEQLERGMG